MKADLELHMVAKLRLFNTAVVLERGNRSQTVMGIANLTGTAPPHNAYAIICIKKVGKSGTQAYNKDK